MIIDPPVDVSSPRKDIEAWIRKLEGMRAESRTDLTARAAIDRSIDEAKFWLGLQEKLGK